ncbi:hypothetical protein R3I93_016947 [Phoxinus phoxinus]|uniref:Immunoglobulin domain-containing protein n=1 Tax=Phoxinus phoxinus TaxID=58324 RepID=A0AAN9GX24_9TELE
MFPFPEDVTDEVKSVSVMEGDSVTLNTETQKYVLIQWMFGSTRIAEVVRLTEYSTYGERFRDRLKLDQTGSLTITNTRTTDSGLYQLTIVSKETSYMSFNLTVYETPQSISSSERSSSFCAVNNSTINQTENNNITEHQPSSDCIHCCGFTEAVIRLVVSALVGVATVAVLVYDIRSTRSELIREEETRHHCQTPGVISDQQCELSRRFSSRYVC